MAQWDDAKYAFLTNLLRNVDFLLQDPNETLDEDKIKRIYAEDLLAYGAFGSAVRSVTASGNVTLLNTDPIFIEIDPNGADRDVTFPAKEDNNHGYFIHHVGSANTLTLKRSGGAEITTLSAGEIKYIKPSTANDFSALTAAAAGGVTSGPQAFGDNYVITPSVASNNLTVALKTIATTDPSAGDKITIRIGNTKREITAALSVMVNAGNIFNLGSAEFVDKKAQLFVYLGYRVASSTVFILLSRISHARTYADFSGTSANEKYGAYSGSAPASTDEVECIGRIDVQNSGTANYYWSLPTGAAVVNRPIYETDWLDWIGAVTCAGSMTWTPGAAGYMRYKIVRNIIYVNARMNGTTGGSASNVIYLTAPFQMVYSANPIALGACLHHQGFGGCFATAGTPDKISHEKADASNFSLTAGAVIEPAIFWEI